MRAHHSSRRHYRNFSSLAASSQRHQQCLDHRGYRTRRQCIDRGGRGEFHTSSISLKAPPNHYETLGLTPTASAADIKKRFYELSKTHHPDHNPQNQETASKRFMEISGAYNVLGNATSREKYDRENFARANTGSYSSAQSSHYSHAGGRKPTGLSRRRTQFRGPPPSFYRSGRWDNAESSARGQTPGSSAASSGTSSGPYAGQTGDAHSAWPFRTDPNDVPHFDRDRHYRTTSGVEEQLKAGRTKRRAAFQRGDIPREDDSPGDAIGRFLMVGALLSLGIGVPSLFLGGVSG